MRMLVLSCSLAERSRSRVLARLAFEDLRKRGLDVRFVDLRDHPLPLCSGSPVDDPKLSALVDLIRSADGVILGAPVYNFDVNAAAKNMVELTGEAWNGKVVGFVNAAGGQGSYMSVLGFANSLMLDFRCLVVPRFVYATGNAFDDDLAIIDDSIADRVDQLCTEIVRITGAFE